MVLWGENESKLNWKDNMGYLALKIETLENGWNCLCPINVHSIMEKASRKLDCLNHAQPQVFGDGNAAQRICQANNFA